MPDVAAVLIDSRRKDLEALTAASRKSYEGLQAVVQRQVTLVKYALREWQSVAVVMKIAGARDSAAHLDRLGRGALELALSSIRELAQLAVTTQADALNVIKRRIDEDLEEVSRLLHPQAPQPVAARKRVRKVAAKTAKSI
jgi:phasin family protein